MAASGNSEHITSPLYCAATHQLFLVLDLPMPSDEESVLSLQMGPRLHHLAEHPTDHLLMFIHLEGQGDATANEQNPLSQDPCKSILDRDLGSGKRLLRNRQPLQLLDRAQVHHQLKQLITAAEELH